MKCRHASCFSPDDEKQRGRQAFNPFKKKEKKERHISYNCDKSCQNLIPHSSYLIILSHNTHTRAHALIFASDGYLNPYNRENNVKSSLFPVQISAFVPVYVLRVQFCFIFLIRPSSLRQTSFVWVPVCFVRAVPFSRKCLPSPVGALNGIHAEPHRGRSYRVWPPDHLYLPARVNTNKTFARFSTGRWC